MEELHIDSNNVEEFHIADDTLADWAVRTIRDNRAEYERMKTMADAQITDIERKLENAYTRCESQCSFLTGKLQEYFATVPHRKTKTEEKYRLLSGVLKVKRGTPDFVRKDEEVCRWAKESGHGDMVGTIEKPKWKEIKSILKQDGDSMVCVDTGEVVPGIRVVMRPDTFSIDTSD